MKFVAKLQINSKTLGKKEIMVFPKTKKSNCFKDIKSAEKALDRRSASFVNDCRGLIYDTSGLLVLTIAL